MLAVLGSTLPSALFLLGGSLVIGVVLGWVLWESQYERAESLERECAELERELKDLNA